MPIVVIFPSILTAWDASSDDHLALVSGCSWLSAGIHRFGPRRPHVAAKLPLAGWAISAQTCRSWVQPRKSARGGKPDIIEAFSVVPKPTVFGVGDISVTRLRAHYCVIMLNRSVLTLSRSLKFSVQTALLQSQDDALDGDCQLTSSHRNLALGLAAPRFPQR